MADEIYCDCNNQKIANKGPLLYDSVTKELFCGEGCVLFSLGVDGIRELKIISYEEALELKKTGRLKQSLLETAEAP